MEVPETVSFEDSNGPILPAQYNDLIRRRSPNLEGEYRLLWAVLEQAIRSYLRNLDCATPRQRGEFEEVRRWFQPVREQSRRQGLFAFRVICDLLDIDAERLFGKLESLRATASQRRGGRHSRGGELAA